MNTSIARPPPEERPSARTPGHLGTRLHRRRFLLLLIILVAIASITTYRSISFGKAQTRPDKSTAKTSRNSVPVGVAQVRTADVDVSLNGLGTVTPLNTVAVKSRIDGQLMKVAFREGQFVRAGEVLAEIDPRPFQVQLKQAEGQMARDQALLKNALIDLERYRLLQQQESIAKQQVDTQDALVRQYEGVVKMDQAQIDNVRLQLDYCRITAPVSGRLGLRQVDPGNVIHAADPNGIVIITQLQPISVVFSVPEDRVQEVMKRLRAGDELPVDAYDRGGQSKLASGSLVSVDNQIDPATGTIKLKAQFANRDDALFPNQFVNARMLVQVQRGASVIPVAAVQRGAQGPFVYTVNADNIVSVRAITLGPAQKESVAVNSGLKPDEVVVTDGADRLREGAKVEITADKAPHLNDAPPAKREKKKRRSGKLAKSE